MDRSAFFAGLRHRMLIAALTCGLGLVGMSAARADASVDKSLLQIEQVHNRVKSTQLLVKNVTSAAQSDGVRGVADLKPILEQAAASSFDIQATETAIAEALKQAGETSIVDAAAFASAAHAFESASEAFAGQVNAVQGQALSPQVKERLTDAGSGARIASLVEAMASPDLAEETAFSGQVMYVALEALTNSSAAELSAMPRDTLHQQMMGVLTQLRSRTSNEKPLPKDVAKAQEKNRLALTLAALPPADLAVLSEFYASPAGKAKRDALVAAYRQASAEANIKMLDAFFERLAEQLKTNPKLQQN